MGKVEILKVRYDNWQGPKGKLSSYNKDDVYIYAYIYIPWTLAWPLSYVPSDSPRRQDLGNL